MPLIFMNNKQQTEESAFPGDALTRAFSKTNNTPFPKVVEIGLIDSNTSYELACNRTPSNKSVFYTVKIAGLPPSRKLENWLMSGVFWTLHEARTYIAYLKAKKRNV